MLKLNEGPQESRGTILRYSMGRFSEPSSVRQRRLNTSGTLSFFRPLKGILFIRIFQVPVNVPFKQQDHVLIFQAPVNAELLNVAHMRLLELAKLDFLHNGGTAQLQGEKLRRAVCVG